MAESNFSRTVVEVRAAQAGDEGALQALLQRFQPRVRGIVSARTGQAWKDLGLDDDILQETFLDAFVALRDGRIRDEAAFLGWLATCVERNIQDRVRWEQREKRRADRVSRFGDLGGSMLAESVLDGGHATPSRIASGRELEQHLEAKLRTLNPRYREVIALRAYGSMSYEDIAAQMGLPSANTANVLFLRARKELRDRLEE